MTRTTPELAPPSPNFPIHGGSSVESGLEPGTLRPQSRDLTTRPPRPQHMEVDELERTLLTLNTTKGTDIPLRPPELESSFPSILDMSSTAPP
ncbi:hypothetical protein AVEN_59515-1 [Araneus ventricosus]|uniref:Uncharacterized protein n=1 Tax=Araneus ventricosus TaxID=182803 RepID=A0A4Y2PIU0_ARAVE|nr:hypothetical protein AVEN_59515-1 [Araneus ventricosus]